MKRVLFIYLLLICITVTNVVAQPGNPGSAPIGGIVYLLLAAVGFGAYSLRSKKKR